MKRTWNTRNLCSISESRRPRQSPSAAARRPRPRVDGGRGTLGTSTAGFAGDPRSTAKATVRHTEEARDENGQVAPGSPRLDARDRGRRRGPARRDRVLAVHLRPARAGDRRAHQALRGGEPRHQGQAHPRAVRRLPAEDRRRDPRRPGAGRGPALLRLAPGLPEGEAPPAAPDGAVRRRRDRARLLPAGEADEGGRAVLRRAHRRAVALPVLEQEAVRGGRARPREAAPDARRAARHGPEADQARRAAATSSRPASRSTWGSRITTGCARC